MSVALILTPEVGVHYANSGLPKDIFSKPENLAKHAQGGGLSVHLPPNAFALPSLAAPEFAKRYHNFLSRIDNMLADLGKNQPRVLEGVTAVLTGSYWKYYRAPQASSTEAFGGAAGDYSGCAGVAYRQRMEQFYAQREFSNPNAAAANRWKTRALDEANRKWFYQHAEDVFRARSTQFVRRKALGIQLRQKELYTPEADPGFAYSNFLMMISGAHADFNRLSSLVDDAASRASHVGENSSPPMIHWTGFGGFRTLSDSEKQFLILKSILLIVGQGGGLLVDEHEWFALSQTFRARAEGLARSITHGELRLRNRALYLVPHLWSEAGPLGEELRSRLGSGVRLVSSIDLVLRETDANLLVVDPSFIFTREAVHRLAGWARGGRVVVLPRSPLYTAAASEELEQTLSLGNRMDIDLGVSYRLHELGEGKLVLYEVPSVPRATGAACSPWQTFIASVLSVAGIQPSCGVSDGRLRLVTLERKRGGVGLFILNGTGRAVAADILFPGEVRVSDLASSFAGRGDVAATEVTPANRFALEVPPCGILPVAVDGLGVEAEERRAAALSSEVLRTNVSGIAENELPGLKPDEGIEASWN